MKTTKPKFGAFDYVEVVSKASLGDYDDVDEVDGEVELANSREYFDYERIKKLIEFYGAKERNPRDKISGNKVDGYAGLARNFPEKEGVLMYRCSNPGPF